MGTSRLLRGGCSVALAVGAVSAVLAVSACSSGDGDTDAASATTGSTGGATTFVGTVEGTDVSVAKVVDGDDVAVYLCDGVNGRRLDGQLTDGAYEGEVDGLGTVSIEVADDGVTGSLTADGEEYPIEATPATGEAAFLWAEGENDAGEPISAGWVVAPDGTETGGVVTGISDGTSNIRLTSGGAPTNVPRAQSDIIAVLIGVRAPITSLP